MTDTSNPAGVAWQPGEQELALRWIARLLAKLGSAPDHADDCLWLDRLHALLSAPVPSHEHPIRDRGEPPVIDYLRNVLTRRAGSADFNEWQAREVVKYIDSLYASLPPARVEEGPRVKPLLWREIGPVGSDVEAETTVGTYTLSFDAPTAGGATNLWMAGADTDTFEVYATRAEAKAAAQAHYEALILGALE